MQCDKTVDRCVVRNVSDNIVHASVKYAVVKYADETSKVRKAEVC